MFTRDRRRVPLAVFAAFVVLVPASTTGDAQGFGRRPIERLDAITVNLSTVGRPGPDRIEIVIERWSTDRERDALVATLKDKGPGALLRELQRLPRVGYIRRANGGLGWDLHFARQRLLDEGGRQIVVATDRPIRAWEVIHRPRSIDYDFTLAEIRLDRDGKGVGKLSVAAKVSFNAEAATVEIEDFGSEPVRMTDVKSTVR